MKRRSHATKDFSSKRLKEPPALPVELWHMIFSQVSFKDQLACRRVCKHWDDLILTTPKFKYKNRLIFGYSSYSENDQPITILSNSKLQFTSLEFVRLTFTKDFPSLPTYFLTKIGESVTYLDVAKISMAWSCLTDTFQGIVDNLGLFKVLHHFNVGSLPGWIRAMDYESLDRNAIKQIVSSALKSNNDFDYEDAKFALGCQGALYLKNRYKSVILQKMVENLNAKNIHNKKTVDLVAEQVEKVMREMREKALFINTSVRVVSISCNEAIGTYGVKKLMLAVPNVQEINIRDFYSFHGGQINTGIMELLKNLPDKIIQLPVENSDDIDKIKAVPLSNLKHLNFREKYFENDFTSAMADECLSLFPSIESITGYSRKLSDISETHFDNITDIRLDWTMGAGPVNLSGIYGLKNLHSLTVWITNNDESHFLSHNALQLKTVTKFEMLISPRRCCGQCVEALLKSLPNLHELKITHCLKWNFMDVILKTHQNLQILEAFCENRWVTFEPKDQWIEMRRLRSLTMKYRVIGGDRAAWNNLGKKLSNLKYLRIHADECVDLEDVILPSIPTLQKIETSDYKSEIEVLKEVEVKVVKRNGKKYEIERRYKSEKPKRASKASQK